MGGAEGCEARLSDSGPLSFVRVHGVHPQLCEQRPRLLQRGLVDKWQCDPEFGPEKGLPPSKGVAEMLSCRRSSSTLLVKSSPREANRNLFIRGKIGSCSENYTVCARTTHRKPRSVHTVSGIYTLLS